jgi:alpha-ketoglutarate-dependent taurine dioxygenase
MKTDLTIYNYPENVDRIFYCERKLLTSLKGCPKYTHNIYAVENHLTSPLFSPKVTKINIIFKRQANMIIFWNNFLTLDYSNNFISY